MKAGRHQYIRGPAQLLVWDVYQGYNVPPDAVERQRLFCHVSMTLWQFLRQRGISREAT